MSYDPENLKVLVVDDKPYMRTLVRVILNGFEIAKVEEAADGSQGFDILRQFNPDLVITDWQMQPTNGKKFVQLIRDYKGGASRFVPIIVMEVNGIVNANGESTLVRTHIGPNVSWIDHPAFFHDRTIRCQDDGRR